MDRSKGRGSGDTAAFERMFRSHYPALCRFAMRFVDDPVTAEELVQSVFTALWIKRDGQPWQAERAYLYAAVRNAALNERKHARVALRWRESEALAAAEEYSSPSPPDVILEQKETTARVRDGLARLPERCRLIMELRWRDQLSYAEIATALGISIKGVENQLSRGLARMRALIG